MPTRKLLSWITCIAGNTEAAPGALRLRGGGRVQHPPVARELLRVYLYGQAGVRLYILRDGEYAAETGASF